MNPSLLEMLFRLPSIIGIVVTLLPASARAHDVILDAPQMYHLRADGPREWSDFPERAESTSVSLDFDVTKTSVNLKARGKEGAIHYDNVKIWEALPWEHCSVAPLGMLVCGCLFVRIFVLLPPHLRRTT